MGGFNLEKLKQEQIKFAKKIVLKDDFEEIKTIVGIDQAYYGNKIISAAVVVEFPSMKVIEKKYAILEANIPYIPGFLSYRESPAVIEAFKLLSTDPDLIMLDANGILHPRKFGMASHVGLVLDKPTLGITKRLLCGSAKDDKIYVDDEVRAKTIQTKEKANPLFVSQGHRISLKSAAEFSIKTTVPPHKMPEPLHLAHRFADKIRKGFIEQEQSNKKVVEDKQDDTNQIELVELNDQGE